MKKSIFYFLILCLLLSGCRSRETGDPFNENNEETLSQSVIDESTYSDTSSVAMSQKDEVMVTSSEQDVSASAEQDDTSSSVENDKASSVEYGVSSTAEDEFEFLEIPFHWGGNGEERVRKARMRCPDDWTPDSGSISFQDKKVAEFVCYTLDRFEQLRASFDNAEIDAETKEIGDNIFWVYSEDVDIFEKPKKVSYKIWRYYFTDGDLYYGISFFENQDEEFIKITQFEKYLSDISVNA